MKESKLTKNKHIFKEYIDLTDEETKKFILDKDTIWILDANILLETLRLDLKKEIELMEFFKDNINKIWIPYQSMKEFTRNYHNVIIEYENDLNNKISELSEEINNSVENLKVQKEKAISLANHRKKDKIEKSFSDAEKGLKNVSRLIGVDKVTKSSRRKTFISILDLFDGKVGAEADRDTLEKWIDKFNNSSLILPGFKDKGKDEETHEDSCYGDYFIWQYMKKYGLDNNKNILFISNDQKEDWIRTIKGQKKGLHPHLRKEFMNDTDGKDIQIMNLDTLFYHLDKANLKSIAESSVYSINSIERRKDHFDQSPTYNELGYASRFNYGTKYDDSSKELTRQMNVVTRALLRLNRHTKDHVKINDSSTNSEFKKSFHHIARKQLYTIETNLRYIYDFLGERNYLVEHEMDSEAKFRFRKTLALYGEIRRNGIDIYEHSFKVKLSHLQELHFEIVDRYLIDNFIY